MSTARRRSHLQQPLPLRRGPFFCPSLQQTRNTARASRYWPKSIASISNSGGAALPMNTGVGTFLSTSRPNLHFKLLGLLSAPRARGSAHTPHRPSAREPGAHLLLLRPRTWSHRRLTPGAASPVCPALEAPPGSSFSSDSLRKLPRRLPKTPLRNGKVVAEGASPLPRLAMRFHP